MQTLSLIESLKPKFIESIGDVQLEYYSLQIGQGTVHSFFVSLVNSTELETKWRVISNFLALNFQNKLESDFEIWNMYLFYKLSEKIENDLKYQIENDIFSCRKIIVEGQFLNQEIINEHIFNSDLSIEMNAKIQPAFQSNEIIWKALENKIPNKKISYPDEAAFQQIYNTLKKLDEN